MIDPKKQIVVTDTNKEDLELHRLSFEEFAVISNNKRVKLWDVVCEILGVSSNMDVITIKSGSVNAAGVYDIEKAISNIDGLQSLADDIANCLHRRNK